MIHHNRPGQLFLRFPKESEKLSHFLEISFGNDNQTIRNFFRQRQSLPKESEKMNGKNDPPQSAGGALPARSKELFAESSRVELRSDAAASSKNAKKSKQKQNLRGERLLGGGHGGRRDDVGAVGRNELRQLAIGLKSGGETKRQTVDKKLSLD